MCLHIVQYTGLLAIDDEISSLQEHETQSSWEGILGMKTLQQEAMGHYILLETHFIKQSILKVSTVLYAVLCTAQGFNRLINNKFNNLINQIIAGIMVLK